MIIPEWLLIANKNSFLKKKDMLVLFKIGNTTLEKRILNGKMIQPDHSFYRSGERVASLGWKVERVINFIKEGANNA